MASDKYVTFVGCMYGEGKTCEGPPTSQEWMMAMRADRVEGRKRVNAALATNGNRFCFGGGNVLELELALDAAILCRTGSSRVSRAVRISQILFSN